MSSVLEDHHLLVHVEKCSVTAFDMELQLSKDGRDRGLWIFLDDSSEEHAKAYHTWTERGIGRLTKDLNLDKRAQLKFSLTFHSELAHLLKRNVREAALLEWPQVEKLYKRIGEQLERAKKEGLR